MRREETPLTASRSLVLVGFALTLNTMIQSFNRQGKPFAFFLSPLRGPLLHQSLEWFLFVVFPTVSAFAHASLSLYLAG
jgi:hypothetical protein